MAVGVEQNEASESNGHSAENGNGRVVPEMKPSPNGIDVAIRANDAGAVSGLLKELSSFGATPSVDEDDTRLALLTSARTLVRALETPRETMLKHNWAQPGCHTAITTCYKAGVFGILGDKPMTVDEIAGAVGKKSEVLTRVLKHIAAMGYIKETNSDQYAATNFSKALHIPIIGDGYACLAGGAHQSCSKFSEFMEQTNYSAPTDSQAGPYQYAFDTKMNMFQYMDAHNLGKQFHHHMGGYRRGRPSWMDPTFYPVEKELFEGLEKTGEEALLVDIGGSLGHDLEEFVTKYPDAPGRLILQDLPHVIDSIQELHPKVERMKHDFYTEQPVKEARAYYLHSVLHDWTDDEGKRILKPIAAAMKKGYSKLLINENVIPDKGADWQATALDMMMLTLFSSKERTLHDWQQLIEASDVGLKIVKVWSHRNSTESLIECDLV